MKKLVALFLIFLIVLGMTACSAAPQDTTAAPTQPTQEPTETTEYTGYRVPAPMQRPRYPVSENPTTDELRQTAVRAMKDMLSIQWSTDKVIEYNKTGAVSWKDYRFDPDTTYAGLPYADGQTNIFVWYEYYDPNTGRLNFPGNGQMLNSLLGNTCTGSLMWGWSTVCDSLTGSFVNYLMVYKNGCIPVGDYTYDFSISSYHELSTETICKQNGEELMYECYAQMKPADAVTSSPVDHGMMAISEPTVVRDENGKIDPEKSYIFIQDQRAGSGDKFYEIEYGDSILHFSGRTSHKISFKSLYKSWYIPCTTVEFAGKDPYAKQEVKFTGGTCDSNEKLLSGAIEANYPMCILKIYAEDQSGKKTTIQNTYFKREDVGNGVARYYDFNTVKLMLKSSLDKVPSGSTVKVEVTASNGEIFTPVSYTIP